MNETPISSLRDFLRIFLRNAWVFSLCGILGAIAGAFLGAQQNDTYFARTELLLEMPDEPFVEVVSPSSDNSLDSIVVQTQIEVVRSYTNLESVVERLDLANDADFLGEGSDDGFFIDNFIAMTRSWARIGVDWMRTHFGSALQPNDGWIGISSKDQAIEVIDKGLSVYQKGLSRIITVEFSALDPEIAAAVPNAVAEAYIDRLNQLTSSRTGATADWLQKHVNEVRAKLEAYEEQISELRTAAGTGAPGESLTQRQDYILLMERLIEARGQLAAARARLEAAQQLRNNKDSLQSMSSVLDSPAILNLKEQEAEVLRQRAMLSTEFGPRHPLVAENRTELGELQMKIEQEITRVFNSLRTTVRSFQNEVASIEAELTRVQDTARENQTLGVTLAGLEREAEATRELYNDIKRRSLDAQQGMELVRTGASVLSPAQVPLAPNSPASILFVLAGLAAGSVVGFGAIFVREQLDGNIRSSTELEQILGCSCVAIVPRLPSSKQKSVFPAGKRRCALLQNRFIEAINLMASHVHLATQQHGASTDPDQRAGQTLLLSSALPSEGKSTLAVGMAVAVARLGLRVVLVDTDLRFPRVAKQLGISRGHGLLGALAMPERHLEFTHQMRSAKMHVLACSYPVPAPHEVLASSHFCALVTNLRMTYDLVIFDAPPLLGLAELPFLLRLADDVLLVARWGYTPTETIKQARLLICKHGRGPSACVLTQVPSKRYRHYGDGDSGSVADEYHRYFQGAEVSKHGDTWKDRLGAGGMGAGAA